ncbi:TPA: BREX-1 system adenine-specific DNA-methyltransferase PglX [Aeromonas salmonicida]|nr:BREX-1 system adenine-specific DNA-methyltransferase PglX [Aeromonas veronii]HEH9397255.1 BREX-1 system adenine-specific DNA-methyltransferase PglX [Aeromonas salmonicida]
MSQKYNNDLQQLFYHASANDFNQIPGSPIAYWLPKQLGTVFLQAKKIKDVSPVKKGLITSNNDRFIRLWHEVDLVNILFECQNHEQSKKSRRRWYPINSGGDFKKWYGNNQVVINWQFNGEEITSYAASLYGSASRQIQNVQYYFKKCITWSNITTGSFGVRASETGFIFGCAGTVCFPSESDYEYILALLNSKVANYVLSLLNPTLNFVVGDISSIPVLMHQQRTLLEKNVSSLIAIARDDWNNNEYSPGFKVNSLVKKFEIMVSDSLYAYIENVKKIVYLFSEKEAENNRLFIETYGLQDELTPEVPLSEITLTCNPHYRYGGNLTDEEREARLQSDTIAELVSYAIGCMMGRYSLDREGLVYAHAGNEGFKALVEEGAYATFAADEDGILPLSVEGWFADDVASRFEAFVRTVWGAEQFEENLQFIADSLCLSAIKPVKKGGETSREILRRYLSTQFYKDHLKTYKKRPIYWLFSSGKEKAFECLVYLHRYNETTLPRMRTEYVTPLLGQMAGRIERLRLQQTEASTSDAKRIGKEIDSLTKQLAELRAFDDQLKHHADMRITLDLDDGVKVNYGKFGSLLSDVKAITGDKGE